MPGAPEQHNLLLNTVEDAKPACPPSALNNFNKVVLLQVVPTVHVKLAVPTSSEGTLMLVTVGTLFPQVPELQIPE
jgi:hypothetical protein